MDRRFEALESEAGSLKYNALGLFCGKRARNRRLLAARDFAGGNAGRNGKLKESLHFQHMKKNVTLDDFT